MPRRARRSRPRSALGSELLTRAAPASLALLVLALVLRLVFLALAGVNAPLTGDELAYQQLAENFAHGLGLFQTNNPFFPGEALYAWQAPLYPLLLGLLYKLSGPSLLVARLFGVLVSAATVPLVYDLARRILSVRRLPPFSFDASAPRVAFASAALVAIYPGLLTTAHLLLSETLFIFFLILTFALLARALDRPPDRARLLLVLAAGAAWGLATLTRGLTLYFSPLLALWLALVLHTRAFPPWSDSSPASASPPSAAQRPQEAELQDRSSLLSALAPAALFLAACALVILPWTLRNYSVFGQVVVLETKGGVNLWLGNSPYTPETFIRNVWKVGVRDPMLAALPPGELARDRAAYSLALAYIRAEPLTFLARMAEKFADFWGFERNLVDIAEATVRGGGWNSLSKIAADVLAAALYIFLVLWGFAGWVYHFAESDRPARAWDVLFAAFTLYFLGLHLVIFGDGRFHLPLMPLFALYAGWLVVWRDRLDYPARRVAVPTVFAFFMLLVWGREAWAALQVLRVF